MPNNRYRIQAKGPARAELMIYGDIGESWWEEESNDAKTVVTRLAELDVANIDVRINSYGGAVSDGLAIFNALRRHKAEIVTHIDGVAFSIASLIAMGGSKINMAENAILMIHAPWGMSVGNAVDMRATADMLDTFAGAMTSAYERDGGPDRSSIEDWLSDGNDHYFDAGEAAELGLVDNITDSIDIAASLRGANRFTLPASAGTHNKRTASMAKEETTKGGPESPNNSASAGVDVQNFAATRDRNISQGRDEGIKAENKRQTDIRAMFDQPGYSDQVFTDLRDQCLADQKCTTDNARAALIDAIGQGYAPLAPVEAQAQAQMPTSIQPIMPVSTKQHREGVSRAPFHISPGADQQDKIRSAMVSATVGRMGIEKQDQQNPWRGHSLLALARDCLAAAGHNPFGMSDKDIAFRVLSLQTTSDFPVVLEDTMHKLVLNGFMSQPGAWRQFCKVGSVSDLRDWKRITPGLLSDLTTQDEHGSYRAKPIPDGEAEPIAAELVGNIIGVTANVLINDDLNYIETRARGVGAAGERTIDRKVWKLLEANPVMSDGTALFHADHDNLADGTIVPNGDPSIDIVDQMAAALAEQKAPAAKDDPDPTDQYLDLLPFAAVAHRWRRSVLQVINTSTVDIVQAPGTASGSGLPFDGIFPNANPMAGTFSQIATSVMAERLPWYIFADPMVAPVIEVVFLNGQQDPQVTMEQDFNTSGLKWKVELPHGVGAIGFRGAMKNAGA